MYKTYFSEPVASVGPKINAYDELTKVRGRNATDVTLLCPAQSYPVPLFRYSSTIQFFVLETVNYSEHILIYL